MSSSPPQFFSTPPRYPSPSLPLSPPSPVLSAPPHSPIRLLGYRAAIIRMRAEAAATSHSLPLPPPFILSPTRPDAPPRHPTSAPTHITPTIVTTLYQSYEVGESSAAAAARPARGLRVDYGFVATMDREIRRDPERYVGYGITDLWDEIVETLHGAPVSTDTELGTHVREFESMVSRDTMRNLHDVKTMNRMSEIRELQSADLSRQRAISDLLETDRKRREEMRELRAADRARHQQIIQTLTVMQTLQREMIPLQGLVTTLQGQVTALLG
ncbi:hypothetical protein Tco_0690332 [Tanacetum coccineum]